jgi:hypothetical protein
LGNSRAAIAVASSAESFVMITRSPGRTHSGPTVRPSSPIPMSVAAPMIDGAQPG